MDNVQGELLQFKPAADGENGASFEELLAINSDVKAWLTLDNTAIDYPVVQGENNFSYINTDVYGDFALAGSIFLDSDCDGSFHDPYSLLYGHHMENSKMLEILTCTRTRRSSTRTPPARWSCPTAPTTYKFSPVCWCPRPRMPSST